MFLFKFVQSTHVFELINYSEHGTTVDNVLYSCDFSMKDKVPVINKLHRAIKEIRKKRKSRKIKVRAKEPKEEDKNAFEILDAPCMSSTAIPVSKFIISLYSYS